jgi:hypothetical protein
MHARPYPSSQIPWPDSEKKGELKFNATITSKPSDLSHSSNHTQEEKIENKKGFTYNGQAPGSQKWDPFKYTLDSIGIHAPVATKSGKRTRKSRTLSFSKNTRISGFHLHPDPVAAKILSKRKLNFIEKLNSTWSS